MSLIADNLAHLRSRIATATARGGRRANDVTLVAVSKYVDTAATRELVEAGCRDLGESRPQSLWQKAADLVDLPVRWHLIGHLQRNKVRRTLPLTSLVHSLDSERLLLAIEEDAQAISLPHPVASLLEVNVSGDPDKHGVKPDEAAKVLERAAGCPRVNIVGLMCMAGGEGGDDEARREFASLRELRDRLQGHFAGRFDLAELSMGMSGDFEIAIEEGATLVHISSALFEEPPT